MKVLIIEDEVKIADSIKKGLLQENFSADVAYDGEEGYDMAFSENYDVILLDLMLPKMSGSKVCQSLRQEGISTPILMLTAKGEVKDKVDGLNIGADDYLVKPFEFDELVARIKALSRRPENVIDSIMSCGEITLNTSNYHLTIKDTEIVLSKKEYELLEYLLKHKEQTLTKEQIMDNVWSFDANILPNTVEVYIGYLRKKLGKCSKLIKTVRGFGYKISCK